VFGERPESAWRLAASGSHRFYAFTHQRWPAIDQPGVDLHRISTGGDFFSGMLTSNNSSYPNNREFCPDALSQA
jgi:hypothetical protein